ncbi:MAG: hypothetical protein KC543_08315 [Myxococcales bacterium]|nr:hypothetical protein [Myxococcales bacterium]
MFATWRITALALVCWLGASAAALAQPFTFTPIAREFTDGLGFLNADVPVALAEDGSAAFVGDDPLGVEHIFVYDGGTLHAIDVEAEGLGGVSSVQINGAGDVVFFATRPGTVPLVYGAYATDFTGSFFTTLYEGEESSTTAPPVGKFGNDIALSENRTVAFSSIVNASGALYRGVLPGPVASLRDGSGIFFNTKHLDVNDAGQVVVEMEYGDPTKGLARGALLFDSSGQDLVDIDTAIEKLSVGVHPRSAINGAGKVAFATNASATATFYDPPDDAGGTVVETLSLDEGVYLSTPTAFGQPSDVTAVATTADGFDSFLRADINGSDVVVFEGYAPSVGYGVFYGDDPATEKVVVVGDIVDGRLFSVVRMGELNDSGEMTLLTSDFYTTDREVWIVSGIDQPAIEPEPTVPPWLRRWRRWLRWILRWFFA